MARTRILGYIFDPPFFLPFLFFFHFFYFLRRGREGPEREVENEKDTEEGREKVRSLWSSGGATRGPDRARGEMGEGRQVMLGPRHTYSGREKEREISRKRGGKERESARDQTQTHVLLILRRARARTHTRTPHERGAHTRFEHTGAEAF